MKAQRKSLSKSRKTELDHIVLDIELILISVIQGVALTALAISSLEIVSRLEFIYFFYIVSAFLLILIFWSQAIVHAISFIKWPINMMHTFLYFLASLVEVMAFSEIKQPLLWFGFLTVFFFIVGILYFVDLRIITSSFTANKITSSSRQFLRHVYKRHLFELYTLVPLGFITNAFFFALIYFFPKTFLEQHYHILLIAIQVLLAGISLQQALAEFSKKTALIEQTDIV